MFPYARHSHNSPDPRRTNQPHNPFGGSSGPRVTIATSASGGGATSTSPPRPNFGTINPIAGSRDNTGPVNPIATAAPSGAPTVVIAESQSPAPQEPAVDYRELAELLYPWLTRMPELLTAFVDAWQQYSESPNAAQLALAAMRQHPAYDRYFAGNAIGDGRYRLSEVEYLATTDGYARNWVEFEINPEVVARYNAQLIEGDISVAEHRDRIGAIHQTLLASDEYRHSRDFYARNYGIDLNDQAILLSAIDPGIGREILQRRLSLSQLGGAALAYGYQRSLSRVEQLAPRIEPQDALRFYAGAQARIGTLAGIAARYRDDGGRFGIGDLEDADLLNDGHTQRRLQRLVRTEQAHFGREGAALIDREGRAVGLRPDAGV